MDDTSPKEAEEPGPPRDLRAELFEDLSARFAAALESDESLPATAQEALVDLLDSDAPTADQIIAASLEEQSRGKGGGQ